MASISIGEFILFTYVLAGISLGVLADEYEDYEDHPKKVKREKWPEAVVPYIIDDSLGTAGNIGLILAAMDIYEQNTCVRFLPRTDQENYIRFDRDSGCYATVAMVGGEQIVSVGRGCEYLGTVLNLLANTLGLQHEHNSPDRDDHLAIHWDHIHPTVWNQFVKMKMPAKILTPMDHDSITMFGEYSFSVDGRPIMESLDGFELPEIYEKTALSPGDISGIKALYHC